MTDLISYTMTRKDLDEVLRTWDFVKGKWDYYYMTGLPKGIEIKFKPHIKQYDRDFVSVDYEYNTPKLGNGGMDLGATSLEEVTHWLKYFRKKVFPKENEVVQLSIFDLM